jgi:hypothetical protein
LLRAEFTSCCAVLISEFAALNRCISAREGRITALQFRFNRIERRLEAICKTVLPKNAN